MTAARPWYKDAIYDAIDIESCADPDGERHAEVISTEPLRMHLTGHGHSWLRVASE
jgi:hypothetical protein